MSDLLTDSEDFEYKPDDQLDTEQLARKRALQSLRQKKEGLMRAYDESLEEREDYEEVDEVDTLRGVYDRKAAGTTTPNDAIHLNENKQRLILRGFTEDQIGKGKRKLFKRFQQDDRDAVKAAREKESDEKYKAFFDRANDPNRTLGGSRKLGVGQKSSLYTRNSELKKARRLRKMGFTAAANQVAANWAGSAESKAPSIASQNFLNAREASAQKVDAQRAANERLQRALMERMEEKLKKDPNFMPQGDARRFQEGNFNL
jgi:hypothetical protein